ncbi:MAG: hypothetical protein JSV91_14150 [Phycisphaerales bacterium]|nr:MAG: hypothetical protein JSV91_14150 [Phycisphaerales bacterium]
MKTVLMEVRSSLARLSAGAVIAVCLLAAPAAHAGYISDFEGLNASPAGVILTGQDMYYIPPDTDSVDFLAFTYAGNVLGFPQNPNGGSQFVGGTGPGNAVYARAQRDVQYGDGTGVWTIAYDFAATYLGSLPSAQNIGSVSTQGYPDESTFIHLFTWVDPNDPVSFNAFYMGFDAAGNAHAQPGYSPGPAWENLPINHWYRSWTAFDLDTNMILEVGIIDLTTGIQSTYAPADWYLAGGQAGGLGPPTGFRFFAGGGVEGNTMGFDNISITPAPAALALLGLGGLIGVRRRR